MSRTRFDPADPLISDDYSGWWRRSMAVVRRGWRPLVMLQLLIAVPLLVLQIPTQIYSERLQRDADALAGATTEPDPGVLIAAFLVVIAGSLLVGAVYVLGMLASVRMVAVIANGGVPRIGDALGTAARRIPAMIGWYVLSVLLALVAILACFLPVFYVGAVLIILPAVVLFERGGAIARCFQLFHADLGAAVARVATLFGLALVGSLAFGLLTLVVTLAVQGTAALDVSADVSGTGTAVVGTVSALLNAVYTALVGVVGVPLIVAAYADMRARHEPFTSAALVDGPAA